MDIVEEIRQNREKGAKRLESEYKSGLMALARRFCADASDAEELVNATFATVIENIDSYLEQSAFFGWMCQILTSHHSRNVRRKSAQDIVYPGIVPDAIDEKAQDAIYDNLDAALLRKAIDELPKEQRDAIALHYFMDMSVVQIAKYLAVPTGTVMSRLHYARKALAAKMGAKAEEIAKKPGGKAVLLALALCALTAVGAVWWGELSERAAIGETGETGGTGGTGGSSSVAPVSTPVPPDSPVPPVTFVPVVPSTPLSKEPTMNTTTRSAALGAATALALAAAPPAATADSYQNRGASSWDGQSWVYDTSRHVAAQPSTGASPSVALAASRASGVSADGPLDAVFVTRQISNGSPINGGTPAFTLIIR